MSFGDDNAKASDRVEKGYAVVNIDARGSWNSEGNMYFWGNNVRIREIRWRI